MKASRFEDLMFWQKARELTRLVYSYTGEGRFSKDFGLKDQIQRSAVSVMSNIAEGFGRGSNKEFVQYLFIARGSLVEVQSQLYISKDLDYIAEDEFSKAFGMSDEISRMVNTFIGKIKENGKQGLKSSL